MDRNTPVRKPHTSTADLLTWSETPPPESHASASAHRSASRSHQPSDGISKVVFGGQVTDEEVESLNKRKPCSGHKLKEITGSGIFAANGENETPELVNATPNSKTGIHMYQQAVAGISHISFGEEESVSLKKPTTIPEVAKQRELSGTLESESEANLKKQLSDAKCKELSGHDIFAPPPEILPRPTTGRAQGLKENFDMGEPAPRNVHTSVKVSHPAGGQSSIMSTEEPVSKTAKKISNQKFAHLSGNDIFKGDGPNLLLMLMAVAAGFPSKRRKLAAGNSQNDLSQKPQQHPLLPGLSDDVALLCLSRLRPSLLFSVCCSWRRLLYSPSFPPFLSLYALLSPESLSDPSSVSSSSAQFFSFDPISSDWHVLPPPPPEPSFLLRHPSFISRNLPIQSVSVAGNLVLLAATTTNLSPALPRPLVFNPLRREWAFGPQLVYSRRWCAAGSSKGAVYVASGIGSHYSADVARSAERWDLEKTDEFLEDSDSGWEILSGLKDGRFSREAIDTVGWRGKLCMVNVKGNAAKEGVVYDVERDTWEEMPAAMIAGWRGPVAAMDEDSMYVVDESRGALRRFDPEREEWESVTESESLRGAEQMAAGGGRVCVVSRGRIVVVDVTASPARLWAVETPPGLQAVAVHILPRMSKPHVLASSTSSSSNSRE